MNAATAQCPLCFTRSPVPADGGEVVCPSCEHAFTPTATAPSRKNPDVPYARPLSSADAPPPAAAPPARRAREDDEDERPRPRSRRRSRYDDDPPPRGNSALPFVLIAGGVLAVLTLGGVAGVAAVLFSRPSAPTAPAVAISPGPMQAVPQDNLEPEPFDGMRAVEPGGPGPAPPWKPGDPFPRPQPVAPPMPVGPRPNPRFPEPPKPPERRTPPEQTGRLIPRPAEKLDPNTNALVAKHKAKLKVTASSQWGNWPAANLLDGSEKTSWYSNAPDTTLDKTRRPWVTLTFPEDVSVKRVTILGNRDPEYTTGYTVTDGKVELLDADGNLIAGHTLAAAGEKFDFNLVLAKPTPVRAVRFTMTASEGGQCGLGEIQVE